MALLALTADRPRPRVVADQPRGCVSKMPPDASPMLGGAWLMVEESCQP